MVTVIPPGSEDNVKLYLNAVLTRTKPTHASYQVLPTLL